MSVRHWFLGLLPLFFSATLLAQRKPPIPGSTNIIREDVDLVLVSAVVTDHKGASVTGLAAGQFTILEDKARSADCIV